MRFVSRATLCLRLGYSKKIACSKDEIPHSNRVQTSGDSFRCCISSSRQRIGDSCRIASVGGRLNGTGDHLFPNGSSVRLPVDSDESDYRSVKKQSKGDDRMRRTGIATTTRGADKMKSAEGGGEEMKSAESYGEELATPARLHYDAIAAGRPWRRRGYRGPRIRRPGVRERGREPLGLRPGVGAAAALPPSSSSSPSNVNSNRRRR
ncbi:hypothetical protein EVAR_32368_1 [Eumeta japonica]|uniref:Uncharacterized protein n=1 Tax=Eumeta variegata TaxID=151549 RepID=A0A4C1VKB8_EUMVA|nr:hypothetical protein EVAR_32368_1 [Eumeta japonica]